MFQMKIWSHYKALQITYKEYAIFGLVLSVQFFIFRTSIPFLKYPFLFFFTGIILYTIVFFNRELFRSTKEYFRNFYLAFILFAILILSFIFSSKIYLFIAKDIVNILVLFSLQYLSMIIIRTKAEFERFIILFGIY